MKLKYLRALLANELLHFDLEDQKIRDLKGKEVVTIQKEKEDTLESNQMN